MFRRRRPLLRAAAVGGAGYAAGKRRRGGADEGEPEGEPAEEVGAGSSGALDAAGLEELQKLGELEKSGVLTQAEFEEQKRKLLGG